MRNSLAIDKVYIDEHYWNQKKSIHVIADELGTYPNKVRREILKYFPKLRDKAEAQVEALKSGTSKHPTKGRTRTEDEKNSISSSIAKNWEEISDEERDRRVKAAQKRWKKIPKDKRKMMSLLAAEGVRKAAKKGSSLELFLLDELTNRGYNILFHSEALEGTTKMHVDLLVPESKTAIEIDGPSHFLPIWGDESLENHQKWDKEKNAILMQNGFNVIRVKLYVNTISRHNRNEILSQLESHLTGLTTKSSQLIEIEVR